MSPAMRHSILAVVSLSLPLAVLAQDAPRVLFCSGPCFAVDAQGARAPVAKGSLISPGQRLETGPGSYAQVKLGRAGLGIAENSRVRFEPGAITLDQGRLRAVTGTSPFMPISTLPPIRTPDGDLALKSGDIEIKKTVEPGTLVKLNAGDATVRGNQGELPLPKEGLHSLQGGRPLPAAAGMSRELVLTSVRKAPEAARPGAGAPPVVTPPRALPPVAIAPRTPVQPLSVPPIRAVEAIPNIKVVVLDGTSKTLPEVFRDIRTNVAITTTTTEQRLTQTLLPPPPPTTTLVPVTPTLTQTTATFTPQTTTTRPTIQLTPTRLMR